MKSDYQQLYISLLSILHQKTTIQYEIVLVCDGPISEELQKIINKIAKLTNSLRVFRLSSNKGLGYALNYGLSKCKAELVARFDTDDVNHLDKLQKQVEFMDKNSKVSVLFTSLYEFISSKETFIKCEVRKACPSGLINYLMSIKCPIFHPSVIFRRKDVIKTGNYPDQTLFEDYLLWLKMRKKNFKFASIQEPLVYMRMDGSYKRRYGRLFQK